MNSAEVVTYERSFPVPSVTHSLQGVFIGGGALYAGKNVTGGRDVLLDAGLDLTGMQTPTVLIVPSARWKSEPGFNKAVRNIAQYYMQQGLVTDSLHDYLYYPHDFENPNLEDLPMRPERIPSQSELQEKIEAADLFFIMGGDTNRQLNQVWRPLGIDAMMQTALKRGAKITGSSAGTNVWFEGIHTDSSSLQNRSPRDLETFHYMRGLGYVTGSVICAHYNGAPSTQPNRLRKTSFDNMMYRRRRLGELGIGIDNYAALQIGPDGLGSVLTGYRDPAAGVHAIHYRGGAKSTRTLAPGDGQFDLSELVA